MAATEHSQTPFTDPADQSVQGSIDRTVFSKSIPDIMFVGQTYSVTMLVTNTGAIRTQFLLVLDFPFSQTNKYFFYDGDRTWLFALDAGASLSEQLKIVPQIEHVGALVLKATLYQVTSREPLNIVTAEVNLIRLSIPPEWSLGLIVSALFAISVVVLLRLRRKAVDLMTLMVPVSIFLLALALRGYNFMNVGIYWDEIHHWQASQIILVNDWAWPEELMSRAYPPVFFYLEAVITYLFGSHFDILRTLSVIAGAATVLPVYGLAKRLFGGRVALVSGVTFAFYGQAILLSRITRLEALMLLLMMVSLYFFWVGYGEEDLRKLVLSGLLLGIALDTKYIALAQLLAVALFVVWVGRSLRPLLGRKFLAWLVSLIAAVAPIQLALLMSGLVPYLSYFESVVGQIWTIKTGQSTAFFPADYVWKTLRIHLYVIGRAADPSLPWLHLFEIAILLLLVIVPLYYVLPLLKRRCEESFVIINFLVALLMFIAGHGRNWWIIYEIPWLFMMICDFGFRIATSLRSSLKMPKVRFGRLGVLRVAALLLVAIFVISDIGAGSVACVADRGDEGAAIASAMWFVKEHARPGDLLAHVDYIEIQYYVNLFELNVTLIPIYVSPEGSYTISGDFFVLRPRFVIVQKSFFDAGFNMTVKRDILAEYAVAYVAQPQVGYVWTGSLWGGDLTDHFVYLVLVSRADWLVRA